MWKKTLPPCRGGGQDGDISEQGEVELVGACKRRKRDGERKTRWMRFLAREVFEGM